MPQITDSPALGCYQILCRQIHEGTEEAVSDFLDYLEKHEAKLIPTILQGWVEDKGTPFHVAARGGKNSILILLYRLSSRVSLASPIDVQDREGGTPLMAAAVARQVATVVDLLKNKANVNAGNHIGKTALHCLLDSEVVESWYFRGNHQNILTMIDILLENKADLEVKNKAGQTPLLTCAALGNLVAVKNLLAKKANYLAQDEKQQTILDCAAPHTALRNELLRFLQEISPRTPSIEKLFHRELFRILKNYRGNSRINEFQRIITILQDAPLAKESKRGTEAEPFFKVLDNLLLELLTVLDQEKEQPDSDEDLSAMLRLLLNAGALTETSQVIPVFHKAMKSTSYFRSRYKSSEGSTGKTYGKKLCPYQFVVIDTLLANKNFVNGLREIDVPLAILKLSLTDSDSYTTDVRGQTVQLIKLVIGHGIPVEFNLQNYDCWLALAQQSEDRTHFCKLFRTESQESKDAQDTIDLTTRGKDTHLLRLLLSNPTKRMALITQLFDARKKCPLDEWDQLPGDESPLVVLSNISTFSYIWFINELVSIAFRAEEPFSDTLLEKLKTQWKDYESTREMSPQKWRQYPCATNIIRANLSSRTKELALAIKNEEDRIKELAKGKVIPDSASGSQSPGDSKGETKSGEQRSFVRAHPFAEYFNLKIGPQENIQKVIQNELRRLLSPKNKNYLQIWLLIQAGIILTKSTFGDSPYSTALKNLLLGPKEWQAVDPFEKRRLEINCLKINWIEHCVLEEEPALKTYNSASNPLPDFTQALAPPRDFPQTPSAAPDVQLGPIGAPKP